MGWRDEKEGSLRAVGEPREGVRKKVGCLCEIVKGSMEMNPEEMVCFQDV